MATSCDVSVDLEPTDDERPQASEINKEVTSIRVDVGRHTGFTSVTEYAVPGGWPDVPAEST
jgi:hypothetical protein